MTGPESKTIGSEPAERSRKEKAKGMAWLFGSLVVALVIISAFMTVTEWIGGSRQNGLALAAIIAMDALVFRWGVRKFDIVPPKHFRAAMEDSE